MSEVTDPELLKQLNAPPSTAVTDPAILAQLNEDPNRSVGDRLLGGFKATGQGALNALTGLFGLPGEITNATLNWAGIKHPHFQTQQDFDETARRYGLHYDPQNRGERLNIAMTEGAGSTVGPGVPAKLAMVIGALMGAGGELGSSGFQDEKTGDSLGKLVGTVGGAAAIPALPAIVKHGLPPAIVPPIISAIGKIKIPDLPDLSRGIARGLLQLNLPNYGQGDK